MRLLLSLLLVCPGFAYSLFEENRGQAPSEVRFWTGAAAAPIAFEDHAVAFHAENSTLRLRFPGARALAWQGEDASPESYFYLTGSRRDAPAVHRYARIKAIDVYPGIDLLFYTRQGRLEYDFLVHPGANPALIRLAIESPDTVSIASSGELLAGQGPSAWRQHAPTIYQGARQIPGRFTRAANRAANGVANEFHLQLGAYDPAQDLVVDPVLEFATYLGGAGDDEIVTMGDGYVAGNTTSPYFPSSQFSKRRGRDIFIRTLASPRLTNPSWADRVYVFGGSADDTLTGLTLISSSSSFQVLIGGTTSSPDLLPNPFISAPDVFLAYRGGDSDAFIANLSLQLDGSGRYTVNSRHFVGGSGADRMTVWSGVVFSPMFAGVTNSPDLPVRNAIQDTLNGGLDAFFGYAGNAYNSPSDILSYLGGSGDDTPLALRFLPNGLLMAGETSSPDFPQSTSPLAGPTDAFLVDIGPIFASSTVPLPVPTLRQARTYGGAGADRIKAFGATPELILLIGEGDSPDFPADSPALGGLDIFTARIHPTEYTLQSATRWGGSGDDRVNTLASYPNSDYVIAGSTTSPDLPLPDPRQSSLAGASDAFYAFFSPSQQLRNAGYFGGAQDDTATALFLAPNNTAMRLAGHTTSSDLPTRLPWQSSNAGGADAFIADIAVPILSTTNATWTAKGFSTFVQLRAPQSLSGVPVKIAIADPSVARLRVGTGWADEITVSSPTGISVQAVADAGETELTFAAEGFAPARVRIRAGKAVVSLASFPSRLNLFASNVPLNPQVLILDPATGTPVPNFTFSHLLAGSIRWSSSAPEVIQVIATPLGSSAPFQVTPRAPGLARLHAESDFPFWPADGFPIEVTQPAFVDSQFTITATELFGGLYGPQWTDLPNGASFRPRGRFRVESEDPSRLLVSLSYPSHSSLPAATAELDILESAPASNANVSVHLRPLASSGSARFKLSLLDYSVETWVNVEFKRVFFRPSFVYNNTDVTSGAHLGPAEPLYLWPRFFIEGQSSPNGQTPPSSADLNFLIEASNPSVVEIPTPTWLPNSSSSTQLRTRAVGRTNLTFKPQGADAAKVVSDTVYPLEVSNNPPLSLSIFPAVVGKNLIFQHNATVRSTTPVDIRLSVDDPSLALLSNTPQSTPASSIDLRVNSPFGFFIHGLAGAGQTTLRMSVAGRDDITTTITLVPSGFAFSRDFATVAFHQELNSVNVSAYSLDPETLAPMLAMSLRPGVTAQVPLRSNAAAFSPSVPACNFATSNNSLCSVSFTWTDIGEFAAELSQPEGFTPPNHSGIFRLRVNNSKLSGGFFYGVKDALVASAFLTEGSRPARLTLSSLDPNLALLSTDPNVLGAESVSGNARTNFYLHGLAAQGFPRIRVTAEFCDPAEFVVPLRDRQVVFASPSSFGQLLTPQTLILGSPQRYIAQLMGEGTVSTSGSRPGIDAVSFSIENSNPAALRFSGPTTFPPGTGQQQMQAEALAAGEAQVSLLSPGYTAVPVNFTSRGPRLKPTTAILPFNMRDRLPLSVEAGAPGPADSTFATVRSLDPSRVLVSRTFEGPAGASATIPWPANQRDNVPVFVEARASDGYADLEVTLPGHDPAPHRVYLNPAAIRIFEIGGGFNQGSGITANVGQELRMTVGLAIIPRPELSDPQNQPLALFGTLRPGAAPIPVELEISDPTVFRVDTPIDPITTQLTQIVLKAIGPGRATLRLANPPGFATHPSLETSRTIPVTLPSISVSCVFSMQLPFDAVTSCNLNRASSGNQPPITATSANPGRLLLAATESAAGQPQIVIASSGVFFLHGLTATGSTRLTLSGPGFADTPVEIVHRNSGFVLEAASSGYPLGPVAVNGTINAGIAFCMIGEASRTNGCGLALRPGALPVSLPVRIDDPQIVSATPNPVTIQPGERGKQITLRGLKPGSTLIELATPTGFYPPIPSSVIVRVNP